MGYQFNRFELYALDPENPCSLSFLSHIIHNIFVVESILKFLLCIWFSTSACSGKSPWPPPLPNMEPLERYHNAQTRPWTRMPRPPILVISQLYHFRRPPGNVRDETPQANEHGPSNGHNI